MIRFMIFSKSTCYNLLVLLVEGKFHTFQNHEMFYKPVIYRIKRFSNDVADSCPAQSEGRHFRVTAVLRPVMCWPSNQNFWGLHMVI